ncbi:MAG: c-type cytochrome [Myxococcota bacterium]
MMRDIMRHTNSNTLSAPALGVLCAVALLSGCIEVGIPAGEDQPWGELNPIQGMHSWPSFKAQEAQPQFDGKPDSMRQPPPRTLPTGMVPYEYGDDPEAAKQLANPVPITEDSLRYGQLAYETTCVVCHGDKGKGYGTVVGEGKVWPRPPSLTSSRLRQMKDGEIYHIISHGRGRMWSYKSQLYPLERWAVVNYVRVLQRADYPEPQDHELVSEN